MREDAVDITMEPGLAGIVLMRPYPGEERGLLLLNVAETEARIRFLPGFRSASFFVDAQEGVVAEFLSWRSPEDLGAAFKQPEFYEHLPVMEPMAAQPTVAFGPLTAVLVSGGGSSFTLGQDSYAVTVLRCEAARLEAVHTAAIGWCRTLIDQDDIDAAAVMIDRKDGQIAVLVAGSFAALEAPEIMAAGATVVQHFGTLRLYGSVAACNDTSRALRYSMIVEP